MTKMSAKVNSKKVAKQDSEIISSEQLLSNLSTVINQLPQAMVILVNALNFVCTDTDKKVVDYLARAAGLESAGENLWKPAPKQEEGV